MIFNTHLSLEGKHSLLSPSKPHWTNYDDEKFDRTMRLTLAAYRGTKLHEFAAQAIRLGVRLPRNGATLNMYVNDAIGYRMNAEQILFYSANVFGTADAIAFRGKKLRIHDLKTGATKTSERQLEIYAALFCLEYGQKPHQIDIENRIYQNDEVRVYIPDPDTIAHIMDRIITFDRRIDELREEEAL